MEDFYRFLDFSRQVLWYAIYVYIIYYIVRSYFKNEKIKSMTPYEFFNDRALEFWLDNVSVAGFLLTLKYATQINWWLETDRVLFDSHLYYFNSLSKNDLKYWLEQFKLATETINDNEIVNIDYIKEKIEEKKKAREEKEWKITLVVISIIIVIGLYYWAVNTDNTETFYIAIVVLFLIILLIRWALLYLENEYDQSRWQILIKYFFIIFIIIFIIFIIIALFSWVVSMIWLPFTVIAVILLAILWQLYKMNNKQ